MANKKSEKVLVKTNDQIEKIMKEIEEGSNLQKVSDTYRFQSYYKNIFRKEVSEKFPELEKKAEELFSVKQREKKEKVEGEKPVKRQKRQVTFTSIKKLINSLFIGITEDEEKKVSELFTPIENFYNERKIAIEERSEAIRLENEIKTDEENLKKKKERVAELKEGKTSTAEPPKKTTAKAAPEEKGVPKGRRAPKKK